MSLRECREIVGLAGAGTAGVLVTLVRAAGSTYRLPGARLLALPDGRVAGTISGGCLEADLLRRAQWRVRDGAVLQRYDTAFEDTAEVPFGLGCGGAVDLLMEAVNTPEAQALLQALQATLQGHARKVATVLPELGRAFSRVVTDDRGDVLFATETLPTEQVVSLRRATLLRAAQPGGGGQPGLFIESIEPAQRLVIFGAGEDARPLVRMASEMGWTVIVADGRPQQARPERFPQAAEVCVTGSAAAVGVTAQDAVVVMTHSYEQDRHIVAEVLPLAPRYLGLLGARHRSALLLRDAAVPAGLSLAEALGRVHAPIGLEVGGDGPEKIALAIVAEVQQALHSPAQAHAAFIENRRMSLAQATTLLQQFGTAVVSAACALDATADSQDGNIWEPQSAWNAGAPSAEVRR